MAPSMQTCHLKERKKERGRGGLTRCFSLARPFPASQPSDRVSSARESQPSIGGDDWLRARANGTVAYETEGRANGHRGPPLACPYSRPGARERAGPLMPRNCTGSSRLGFPPVMGPLSAVQLGRLPHPSRPRYIVVVFALSSRGIRLLGERATAS